MKSILALLALGTSLASALSYQPLAVIPWTPSNATSVDQSIVYNGTYYLADRTNKGVHIVDLVSKNETALIQGGFQGLATLNGKANTAVSGPDGLLILPNRKELYVGDSNGSIKVVDLTTNKIIANITVNSTQRADEMAYNPETGIVVCTIPNEAPPRLAVISATNHTVAGYITFNNASGLEQPAWNSADKQFYISVPSTGANPGGEIAIVDVNNLNITKVLSLPKCVPAGIAFGPNQNLFVGCSQDQILSFNISNSLVLNVTTGNVIANISGLSGVDQVAYDSGAGYYYAAAYQNLAGGKSTGAPQPQLAVINATTNTLSQLITTDSSLAHSVAVDPTTHNLIVPLAKTGINIFTLSNSTTNSTSGPPSSTSSGVSKIAVHVFYYVGLVVFVGTVLS